MLDTCSVEFVWIRPRYSVLVTSKGNKVPRMTSTITNDTFPGYEGSWSKTGQVVRCETELPEPDTGVLETCQNAQTVLTCFRTPANGLYTWTCE